MVKRAWQYCQSCCFRKDIWSFPEIHFHHYLEEWLWSKDSQRGSSVLFKHFCQETGNKFRIKEKRFQASPSITIRRLKKCEDDRAEFIKNVRSLQALRVDQPKMVQVIVNSAEPVPEVNNPSNSAKGSSEDPHSEDIVHWTAPQFHCTHFVREPGTSCWEGNTNTQWLPCWSRWTRCSCYCQKQ